MGASSPWGWVRTLQRALAGPHRGSPRPRKGKDWPEVTQQELRTVLKALDSLYFWTLA